MAPLSSSLRRSPATVGIGIRDPVKVEIFMEEESAPFHKRMKGPSVSDQLIAGHDLLPVAPSLYHPLNEPSPLGLRLKKSPSLLDLIDMKLSQGKTSSMVSSSIQNTDSGESSARGTTSTAVPSWIGRLKTSSTVSSSIENTNSGESSARGTNSTAVPSRIDRLKTSSTVSSSIENTISGESSARGTTSTAVPSGIDRLKASNFPASLLRIGLWEYASRYQGDLVTKCYFAKHKIVWEVLDGGLKSKIEIQWSNIMDLNVKIPEDGPASMTIVLARQPLFYREINPQPRKHTLWQPTVDFTNHQASIHRKHFLQVPLGVLNRHFEKLIQCDSRLNYLSRQPEMVLDSPYFDSIPPPLQDFKDQQIAMKFPTYPDALSSSSSVLQTCLVNTGQTKLARSKNLLHEAPSPSSVMDSCATEGSVSIEAESLAAPTNWEQLIMEGLPPSMSMNEFVNYIRSCNSGEGNGENPSSESQEILKDIAQHLLNESPVTFADEVSLMRKVNSLYSLLHKDGTSVQLNTTDHGFGGFEDRKDSQPQELAASSCKSAMPRKESYGELLHNLPRIASFPKFFCDISEGGENQAR